MREVVELVPISKVPPPWHLAIDSIQSPFVPLLIPNKPTETHIAINEALWVVALHWVFKKKWSKRHKIPANRAVKDAVKPLGELLYRILELCIQCHAVLPVNSTRCGNAAQWFDCVVWETKRRDFAEILFQSYKKGQGKKQEVGEIWTEIRLLKGGSNPFNLEFSPHSFRLVDEALKLAKLENFNQEYWRPLLKAYSNWARALDQNDNWKFFRVEAGKLVAQNGRGRGRLTVPLL